MSTIASSILASLGIIEKSLPEEQNDNYINMAREAYVESLAQAGYTLEQKQAIVDHDDTYLAAGVMAAGKRSHGLFKRDEHLQEVNFHIDMGTNNVNGILSREFENDDGDKVYNHAVIEDKRVNPHLSDVRGFISGLLIDDE